MKKIIIAVFCALALGSTAFAYDLSVGFGGVYGYINDSWEVTSQAVRDWEWSSGTANRIQYGGFAFFGNRYTDFNFSVKYSNNTFTYPVWDDYKISYLTLSVGAYGKFPISFWRFILFPTIGVDFEDLNEFLILWGRGGLGLDFFFTDRLFLRGQALYGYGIHFLQLQEGYKSITPGHAPLFKLGFGMMF